MNKEANKEVDPQNFLSLISLNKTDTTIYLLYLKKMQYIVIIVDHNKFVYR